MLHRLSKGYSQDVGSHLTALPRKKLFPISLIKSVINSLWLVEGEPWFLIG